MQNARVTGFEPVNTGVWSQKFDLNKHFLEFYFISLKRNVIILFCESPVPYRLAIPVYKVPYFRDFIGFIIVSNYLYHYNYVNYVY